MIPSVSDYEKLGAFYLGREYDLDTKSADGGLVLYDSKDLVTHGVVLGMTGSGKTGLCLALLEEAAMDNIPAIVIDPKGDISNLLLMFPDLAAEDFRPWINEDDAAKKEMSPDEFAAKTAETWKKGLADWGQEPDRIAKLKEKVDITIFTPGSKAGIPVSIMSSLEVPPFEVMDNSELLGERIMTTTTALLTLVGVKDEASETPEAVLVATIFQKSWESGQNLSLETLIRHIQKPAFDKVGVMDLESFLPQKNRQALALKFNNLLASPGFSTWLEGPPLDIAKMLHTPQGKPRISIFSIAHLSDADRMFFVSLLLNQTLGWMRGQRGTTSLRAILYMDEIYGYLPPTANPPSKIPMMTLLKQARAFGLGCLLATQNPVDLDYKALSNIGTWFLGRLQTERDKLRVLDGLEGAAGAQNARFDRSEMEKLLSGLGNRVFLMNNVHEDHPVLFHVRWVMSFLTGPLTRTSIKTLMDPKRADFGSTKDAVPAAANPMAIPGMSASTVRPPVGAGIVEKFANPGVDPADIIYRPHLFLQGIVYFSELYGARGKGHQVQTRIATAQFMHSREDGKLENRPLKVNHVHPTGPEAFDTDTFLPPPLMPSELADGPAPGARFAALPGFAMSPKTYKKAEKDFLEWMFRNYHEQVYFSPLLEQYSAPREPEQQFRVRIAHEAREARDAALDKIRTTAARKLHSLEGKLNTASGTLARQQAESQSAKMQAGASILGGLLGGLFGRKRGVNSAISRGTNAYKQHQDVGIAEEKVEAIQQQIKELKTQLEAEISSLTQSYDSSQILLQTETLKPKRTDVSVDSVSLLWLPYDDRGEPAW